MRIRRCLVVLLSLLSSGLLARSQDLPSPSPSAPIFQERPFGPRPVTTPTPEAKRVVSDTRKPIPASWTIAGAAATLIALAAVLYGAIRAWRSSNLFGRQYRLPVPREVALRFGASKSGGHMATLHFGDDPKIGASKTESA